MSSKSVTIFKKNLLAGGGTFTKAMYKRTVSIYNIPIIKIRFSEDRRNE